VTPPAPAPASTSAEKRCVACGAPGLVAHLRVAGETGPAGLIPTTDQFGTALSDIVRCGACGHMQLESFPAEVELSEAYGEAESGDYVEEEAGQRETARRLMERIERHAAPGGIVDLGCWTGFLLSVARERGWGPVLGVEPSRFAADYARSTLGLEVREESLLSVAMPPAQQAVVMADVIEHLVDPGAALDRIAAALAPGGVLLLVLPDAGSRLARAMGRRWWSVLPTHVQYFTRRSLATLLGRHGFEVLELGTAPKAFTVRYYLWRISGYSAVVARGLVAGARAVGVAERMWAPDFGDRMMVIARRRS
jgi:SAM-dependent methyltransferase